MKQLHPPGRGVAMAIQDSTANDCCANAPVQGLGTETPVAGHARRNC